MVTKKTTKVVNMDEKKKQKQKVDFNGTNSKIRIDKKSDLPEIVFTEHRASGNASVIFTGQAKPLDSFLSAMQKLSTVFCEICEMEEKVDDTLITTVNFSQKGGIIISGQIELGNGIPQPLCLNTPHVLIESENGYELPDYAKEQVEELKRQAILYANGESAEKQQTLPLDGTDN